ncbi:carbohydrate ABC transporter permease [Paraburkholderia unamae]|uniref:Carbohydrate ABC transporter membrane protein 1 (CUT1 family) n=1 Tax=Paraburkholderia unamae TaxID=219649 RepID=A0ABX5KAT1_9BURK|nr:sugar ABC transporter permease [Paraburkholderia unamae]PVX61302.1 carbohydrate ABC transporter membrane protein 1 (CUT1 family) [Paraburkholderia unamae]RAR56653.1 carbohydrate ABC transporter membrane protein 1 (CUT1 family) [Paraburkholderia unamae]
MNIAISAAPAERTRISSQWLVITVFLAPAVVLLAIFLLYPLLSSLKLSLVDWTGLGTHSRFVGLANWAQLARDTVFWHSLWNNVLLALASIVFELPIALALAVLLEKAGRGSRLLKILYFLPLLMSSVAIGVLFKNVYDPNFGPLNVALHAVGLDSLAQDWLGDTRFSLASTIAVICWQNVPFYMILFLAGLSSMSAEIREAALLDGASEWTIFWRIKLPHLQDAIRTAVLLSVLGSLRYFDLIYVMTGGGPEGSSELMATYMYRTVFSSFQLGYGSTIGSAMFLIVSLVAAIALRFTRRYETEV